MVERRTELAIPKPDMTPMIDCVFQLMIFFMLTLKIVSAEGNFDINMPIGQSSGTPDPLAQDLKVRLKADVNGNLVNIQFGSRSLGNDERAFAQLNEEVLRSIGGQPGGPAAKDAEVELDADYNLHYSYIVKAISACTGRFDKRTKQVIRYIEKIKFAPPKAKGANS
ncbi:MAG: Biopolymer transport protein ExbD/TolR [Planctomycetaceae bacterium]|nr:Biopolymer transport protein ExbD/TolR [Planctomycetaceae bacterium]